MTKKQDKKTDETIKITKNNSLSCSFIREISRTVGDLGTRLEGTQSLPYTEFHRHFEFREGAGFKVAYAALFRGKERKKKKNCRSGNKGSSARTTMKQKIQNITRTSWAHIMLEPAVMYQSMVSLTGWGGGGEHRAYDGFHFWSNLSPSTLLKLD